MNIIESKIEALVELQNNMNTYIREIVANNEDAIIALNTEVQLYYFGITSTGVNINSYAPYRGMTIAIKAKKNQPSDRVTLKDTGAFHRSFYVDAREYDFIIGASDDKAKELAFKYGEEIFGLTNENVDEITWDYLFDTLLIKLKSLI